MSTALGAGLALVVALLAVLVAGLLRSHAEILKALHDLGVDLDPDRAHGSATTAPLVPTGEEGEPAGRELDIVGTAPSGDARQLAIAGTRHRTLLAFLSSSCLTCRNFWSDFSDPELTLPGAARLVIVTQGPEAESPSAVAELAPPHVVTLLSSLAWQRYRVPGAPYFVVVDGPSSRVVGQGTGPSWTRVSELLRRAVADAAAPADRESEVDEVLRAAGIGPDHPSLRPGRDPAEGAAS